MSDPTTVVPDDAGNEIDFAHIPASSFNGCTLSSSVPALSAESRTALPDGAEALIPATNPSFVFRDDDVMRLVLWHLGIGGNNLLVHGPTGCGKTALIEQFCSIVGRPVFKVECHEDLRFAEIEGNTRLRRGETVYVAGKLLRALQTPYSVLLLDEMNFIPPGVFGRLNALLDRTPIHIIDETGEVIVPAEGFRIAATANGIDGDNDRAQYNGTLRMNRALLSRFTAIRGRYLDALQELAALRSVASGHLTNEVLNAMVDWAGDTRKSCAAGELSDAPTTRTLLTIVDVLNASAAAYARDPVGMLSTAVSFAIADRMRADEATSIVKVLVARIEGKPTTPRQQRGPSQGSTLSAGDIVLLVNPNRQGGGNVAYWGYATTHNSAMADLFNGAVTPMPVHRVANSKTTREAQNLEHTKRQQKGYVHYSTAPYAPGDSPGDIIAEVAKALNAKMDRRPPTLTTSAAQALTASLAASMGI